MTTDDRDRVQGRYYFTYSICREYTDMAEIDIIISGLTLLGCASYLVVTGVRERR
jgi:hypothetical protein